MYKMVYRIRCVVSYHWEQGEDSLKMVKDLYYNDETFNKMIRIVQQHIVNLFEGTNKKHVLLKLD